MSCPALSITNMFASFSAPNTGEDRSASSKVECSPFVGKRESAFAA